jgi:hypothetical protein
VTGKKGKTIMKRREFLKAGIGAAASLSALQVGAFAAENEKPLRVGLIGTGWYGKTDLFHLIQMAPVEVVGLCDVDRKMVDEAADLVAQRQPSKKRPPIYGDYRVFLKEQKPEIALIGTPDHWHCLPMVEACKAGADVYVQKPISYDVVEGPDDLTYPPGIFLFFWEFLRWIVRLIDVGSFVCFPHRERQRWRRRRWSWG